MTTGLETTIEVLSQSRNEAVGAALFTGLGSNDEAVYDGVLRALLARRKKSGHLEVLKRWHKLTALQRELVQEAKGRMSGALRDAVLSEDEQLFANACQAVDDFSEYDLTFYARHSG